MHYIRCGLCYKQSSVVHLVCAPVWLSAGHIRECCKNG